MVDEAGEAALVVRGRGLTSQGDGFHRDLQWAGDEAADVKEAEAALVLLVRLLGAVADPRVEQDDGWGRRQARRP